MICKTLRGLCEQPRPAEGKALCHHTGPGLQLVSRGWRSDLAGRVPEVAVRTSGIAYMVGYARSCDVEMDSDGE